MAASSKKKSDINKLNLPPATLKKAKAFVQDLGIGVNDSTYYYAILWCKRDLRQDGEFLSTAQKEKFDKEVERRKKSKQYKGPIFTKILAEIALLELTEQTDKDLLQESLPATAGTLRTKKVSVSRKKTRPSAPQKPKVELTVDNVEVQKGERYTVSWKSENANYVSRSSQFNPAIPDKELSGSRTITATRVGSKTFSITVRNIKGSSASAKITVNVVAVKDTPTTPGSSASGPSTTGTQQPRARTTRVTRSPRQSDTTVLKNIDNTISSILGILEKQTGMVKAISKKESKDSENERRRKREGILEMAKGAGGLLVEKALTPIKSIFEKIWRFIYFTLLGRVFTEFLNWFNDPKNKDKVKTLSRFIKDNFWLLIGGAALYFLTPFGGFINSLLGKLAWYTTKLVLSKAALLMIKNPILAFGALAALARRGTYENLKPELDPIEQQVKKDMKDESLPWYKRLGSYFAAQEIEGIKRKAYTEAIPAPGTLFSSGGLVDNTIGEKIRGAGPDTQLTALTPGEVVMNRSAVNAVGANNLLALNKMYGGVNANKPRKLGNVFGMSGGGMVGRDNPKISDADYNALLAIASAEDFSNLQGRADVAQSLYNRLYASKKYGENFAPTGGKISIKDLITGQGQFEPTFKNRNDWLNITDRNSAAAAFAKYKKIPVEQALKVLNETDKILKNPVYQAKAAEHVQGRTFFLGTSQHKNMKPNEGDVVRSPKHNFFSHWYTQDSVYAKERGSIPAPVPNKVLSLKPQAKPQGIGFQNIFSRLSRPASAGPRLDPRPKYSKSRLPPKTSSKPKPKQKPWWDPSRWMGKKEGGFINNNGGHITSNMFSLSGLTEDRFPTLLKAGEYVVPTLTVKKVGVDFLNNLVASTDENSEPAKMMPILRNENIMPPSFTSANRAQVMTLAPIVNNSTSMQPSSGSGIGGVIPSFPTVSPQSSATRSFLAEIYNIA